MSAGRAAVASAILIIVALSGCEAAPEDPNLPDHDSDAPGAPPDTDAASVGPTPSTHPLGHLLTVPAGQVVMGCDVEIDAGNLGCFEEELPQVQVTLTNPLEVMESEVTHRMWDAFRDVNPSYHLTCGEDCPV